MESFPGRGRAPMYITRIFAGRYITGERGALGYILFTRTTPGYGTNRRTGIISIHAPPTYFRLLGVSINIRRPA